MNDPSMAINTGRILCLDTMGFDDDGNIRHGMAMRDKMGEMQRVLHAEAQAKKKESTKDVEWAIVDATWLCQWLMFVHSDNDAPSPGPVHNHRLIFKDPAGVWRPRVGLVMEKTGHVGDYRKIHLETWRVFQDLYDGSGPTITATFQEVFDKEKGEVDRHAEDGHYPTGSWVVSGAQPKRNSTLNIFDRFGIGRSIADARASAILEGEENEEKEEPRSDFKKRRSVEKKRGSKAIAEAQKELLRQSLKAEDEEEEALGTTAGNSTREANPSTPTSSAYKAPSRPKPARRADEFYDNIFQRTSEEDDTL